MIEYDARKWRRQILAFQGSVSPKIVFRLLLIALWSFGVVISHRYFRAIEVPPTGHALIGVALGLLLVFRTNASYDRYWEGRKAWERIANDARNVIRSARALMSDDRAFLEPVVRWTVAFPYACMHRLRGERSLGRATSQLSPAQVAEVLAEDHVPLAVATRLSRLIAESRLHGTFPERAVITIDNNIRSMVESIGTCERIQDTPLPFAYVVHLRRALMLFLLTLPFALVNPFGWATIIYTTLISYVLLGIDEIGVEIENPFGTDYNDLPLELICARIEENLTSILKQPALTKTELSL
ncbi:MAG TPA: bestrophin family ion channel [Opitutaceae bacterium]|nr:bestrophin family ion channel [Opitutaceae bacterium]